MRKIKNKILIALFILNFISVIIFGAALDDENITIQLIIIGFNLLYLSIFTVANTRE